MKNHLNRDNTISQTGAEVDTAIHAALREESRLFPQTAEDIARLKAKLDTKGVPTPDTHAFRQFLRQRVEGKVVQLLEIAQAVPMDTTGELAMAARNGRKISDTIRQKMNAKRDEYEKSHLQKPNDGLR
jgi:hypothetical protein